MSQEGWSNYETWCVHLYWQNEERKYRQSLELIAQATEDVELDDEDECESESLDPVTWLAEAIEDATKASMPVPLQEARGMWGDLLTHALGQVNYREIASEWLEEDALQEGGQ